LLKNDINFALKTITKQQYVHDTVMCVHQVEAELITFVIFYVYDTIMCAHQVELITFVIFLLSNKSEFRQNYRTISRPQFHLSLLGSLASLQTYRHLEAKVGMSKGGGKQWQTTPKN